MSLAPLKAGNISQFNSQIEQLIRQIIEVESQPIRRLQERKGEIQQQQEIFDQASSTLANLQNKAESLSSILDQRSARSSDPNVIDVAAGPGAKPGVYDIAVESLAKAHTLASHRIPVSGQSMLELFGAGEHSFSISTQGKTVDVRFEIPEVLDSTGLPPTNEDILRIIARAIQQANVDAGFGQRGFSADLIKDTPTTARLLLKSNLTGSANQLMFNDPEGVLQVLGVNPNVKASEFSGGYIHGAEGQAKLRQEAANLFRPLADLGPENLPAVSDFLGTIASYAAQLAGGEGAPLAQALNSVIQAINHKDDEMAQMELELAFDSIADLVDRLDDQAVEALAREFLRRAGELRGPVDPNPHPVTTTANAGTSMGNPALADAFDALAVAVRMLGNGADTGTAFEDFRFALEGLTTQDRAELTQQFYAALEGLNALGRKEGEELTDAFVSMVRPLFDLTVEERSSVAVQFFNIADLIDALGTDTGTRAAEEFRQLGDLVESMSQPLSDPLETPYASLYAVFYVLPQETRDKLSTELNRFAAELDKGGQEDVGNVFRSMAEALADPNIQNNFSFHFGNFATAVGSLSLEDRHVLSRELGAFNNQIRNQVPEDQARLLIPNLEAVYRSIGELNQFQRVAFEDRMIAVTEALDQLTTDERARIREEMLNALKHLRTLFPIALPPELEQTFADFNGAANDLSQEDRNILSAELARLAADYQEGTISLDVAHALDALSRAVFYAGEPGSFDIHKDKFLWYLGALNDQERGELVSRIDEMAGRLPALIGEDAVRLSPILRRLSAQMSEPVVFQAPAANFISALERAAAGTGTFNDDELELIQQYLPELADVLVRNVNDRGQELAQGLYAAGNALAQLSPASQAVMGQIIKQAATGIEDRLTDDRGSSFMQQLNKLTGVVDNFDSYEDLDARLLVDGIPVVRGTNTISDLFDRVTLNLNGLTTVEPRDAPRTVKIEVQNDNEAIMQGIQDFIDAYNEAIDFVEKETNIDKETYERGALAGDQDYMRLRLDLRHAINDPIERDGEVDFLRSIGIGVGTGVNDGNHLRIEDPDALRKALDTDLDLVKALLAGQAGAARRVADFINEYIQPQGVIDRDKAHISRTAKRLEERIDTLNERMDAREEFLRNEYHGIAEQLIALGTQTQTIQGLGGFLGGLIG